VAEDGERRDRANPKDHENPSASLAAAGTGEVQRACAVWCACAMGLLDDAIREHLELKRLRGADPGVVAREEQDALGPVSRSDGASDEEDQSERSQPSKGSFFAEHESTSVADFSTVGQETAEIDMDVVLGSDLDVEGHPTATSHERDSPVASSTHTRPNAEDSLEWEMPDDAPKGITEHADDLAQEPDTTDQVDDVLEETPDFLRDTPEQERLWFEQRPPRDFDFNE
jgi:hypothetical protein